MALDPQLKESMAQTIFVAKPTVGSNAGDLTYGAPVSVKARVELMTNLVETTPGNFVNSTHWLSTEFAIDKKDRIWLPGFDETKDEEARLPLSVDVVPDEVGVEEHREVRL